MQWFEGKFPAKNTSNCPICGTKNIESWGFFADHINGEGHTPYKCLNKKCKAKWYTTEEISRH